MISGNQQADVLCITGTRADYGIYRPLLLELNQSKTIRLSLIVTGMHLLHEYGNTIDEVREDSLEIMGTPSILVKGDSPSSMSQSLGLALLYFSQIFEQIKPKSILLLGDRGEMLAAAITAHYQNIPIFHLHGGEVSGSADDLVRHAISKFSHIHFVSSIRSKQHLIAMGEEEWRIIPVGSLRKHDIEQLRQWDQQTKELMSEKYQLHPNKKKILFVMHPDSKAKHSFAEQIDEALSSLENLHDVQIFILGSNSDAGGEVFARRIQQFAQEHQASYFHSIPATDYLFFLSKVDLLMGNSSSGMIEAPFFSLPVINIGQRQRNREQGRNVINVDYDRQKITQAIQGVLTGKGAKDSSQNPSGNPYDLGFMPATEIIQRIEALLKNPEMMNKRMVLNNG